jgi:hypothetical protein
MAPKRGNLSQVTKQVSWESQAWNPSLSHSRDVASWVGDPDHFSATWLYCCSSAFPEDLSPDSRLDSEERRKHRSETKNALNLGGCVASFTGAATWLGWGRGRKKPKWSTKDKNAYLTRSAGGRKQQAANQTVSSLDIHRPWKPWRDSPWSRQAELI